MAITNYLVHFLTEATYNSKKSELRNDAVAFVKDATIIHTHGTDYYCGSGPVALESELSTVAKTGSYNDLDNKPSIPSLDGYATESWVESQNYFKDSISFDDINFANTGSTSQYLAGNGRFYTISWNEISGKPTIPEEYVLPTASADTLGGVKIGNGIVLSDGVISVTTESIDAAASTHYHSASDINSGTLNISRIPTGTSSTTVALGDHTHSQYLEASDLSSYATKTWVESQNYLTDVSWSNISGKPTWIGTSKPSYSYSEISGTIPANDLPVAATTTYGAVRLATNVTANTTPQPITTVSNRTYGIQLDANDRMVVNVPWVEGSTSLSDLGITVSATEINLLDGVTSNIQDQLESKASISQLADKADVDHTHSSDEINSLTGYTEGTSTTTLSSSMTLNQALASLQNQIQGKQDSGNYALKSEIPNTSEFATKTELNDYLPLDGGTLDGNLTVNGNVTIDNKLQAASTLILTTSNRFGEVQILAGQSTFTFNQAGFQIDGNNVCSSVNSTAKRYLIGADAQNDFPVTNSNTNVYMQSGQLYATQMNATNGFYETSDARLKDFGENIKALETLSEIPTKYFTWNSDEKQESHIGTSAQEIQKIYPDLVTSNEDGILSVDYARLSIIALAAIKELKKEIDSLKSH